MRTLRHVVMFGFTPETTAGRIDDIVARFGISQPERTKLERHNILCDEEDGHRYYQLYSKPYGDGFFFEIVERQSGYAGYGAMNAPFRTAALRRILTADRRPA